MKIIMSEQEQSSNCSPSNSNSSRWSINAGILCLSFCLLSFLFTVLFPTRDILSVRICEVGPSSLSAERMKVAWACWARGQRERPDLQKYHFEKSSGLWGTRSWVVENREPVFLFLVLSEITPKQYGLMIRRKEALRKVEGGCLISFTLHSLLMKILAFFFPPSKFQLKAERSGVLEQIATKTQYVLNHVTK